MIVSFFYLNAYSSVGGIQKFNTNVITALSIIGQEQNHTINLLSLHDQEKDLSPALKVNFKSAFHNKFRFLLFSLFYLIRSDVVFLGHCNLAFPITILNKYIFRKKIYLFIHGIEVWSPLPYHKTQALKDCEGIFSVSNFTADKAISIHHLDTLKVSIFPNTLDPFTPFAIAQEKPISLLKKYNLKDTDNIILTITRLSYTEKGKGYDKVIAALPAILRHTPNLKYILAGKIDNNENVRIQHLIKSFGVESSVIIAGFIAPSELVAHYQLCDLFVMPSTKEGFGIVFIEATACGKPTMGGNIDGTPEALLYGQLGYLVNPNSTDEIQKGIEAFFSHQWPEHLTNAQHLHSLTLQKFGFEQMKFNLRKYLA